MPTKKELALLKNMFRELDKRLDAEWEDVVQAVEKAILYGRDVIGTDEDEDEGPKRKYQRRHTPKKKHGASR